MTEDELKAAIINQSAVCFAASKDEARHLALAHRACELSGMIELALLQEAKPSFIEFLLHERNRVRVGIKDENVWYL